MELRVAQMNSHLTSEITSKFESQENVLPLNSNSM